MVSATDITTLALKSWMVGLGIGVFLMVLFNLTLALSIADTDAEFESAVMDAIGLVALSLVSSMFLGLFVSFPVFLAGLGVALILRERLARSLIATGLLAAIITYLMILGFVSWGTPSLWSGQRSIIEILLNILSPFWLAVFMLPSTYAAIWYARALRRSMENPHV